MSDSNPSQSINISGSSFSGSQVGQAGRDQTQTQQIIQSSTEVLSQEKVLSLFAEVENLLKAASLPKRRYGISYKILLNNITHPNQ